VEIICGFPLWLKTKGKISATSGKVRISEGMFTIRNKKRNIQMIIDLQYKLIKNTILNLKKVDNYQLTKNQALLDLVDKML
jgi:hypothetical protein